MARDHRHGSRHTDADDIELESALEELALDLGSDAIESDMALWVDHVRCTRRTVHHLRTGCSHHLRTGCVHHLRARCVHHLRTLTLVPIGVNWRICHASHCSVSMRLVSGYHVSGCAIEYCQSVAQQMSDFWETQV
jgi:hypothetical protein